MENIHKRLSIVHKRLSNCQDTVCILIFAASALKFELTMKKKNPNAVALGKLGGSKGGKIRAERLTAERRSEIARKAVLTRWAKERAKKSNKPE